MEAISSSEAGLTSWWKRPWLDLPPEFAEILGEGNVARVIKDYPSDEQLYSVGLDHPLELLGLYDGIPLTERSVFHTGCPTRPDIHLPEAHRSDL